MRLVFLGSPPFATPVLARLLASRHRVLALVTRPDKPLGRGLGVRPSPLAEIARASEVPLLQPPTTRDPAFVAALRALAPDVLLVASYGEILRKELLELAPHGALNVHASLLPRHRGASPIQAAIQAGDRETGVSIQRMVAALDQGDVLLEERVTIEPKETAGALLERLAVLGGEAAANALDVLEEGRARFRPQDASQATYAGRIRKEHGWIDWTKPAAEIARHVRAMTPWPGARTALESGKELVVLESEPGAELSGRSAGEIAVVDGRLFVACGPARDPSGGPARDPARDISALEVLAVKPAGSVRMDSAAWLRGARIEPGARFTSPARPS